MNKPTPDEYAQRIEEALLAGRKLHAIKLYCEQKGAGLSDAKREIDRLEKELWSAHPEKFKRPPGRGCAALLVAGVILAGAVAGAAFLWK